MKQLLLLVIFALPLAAQNPSVDVLHYRIEITLPASGSAIAAAAELTVQPTITPLATLDLDFAGLTIDEVTIDGQPVAHRREGQRLTIDVARDSSDPFRARIRYHGTPTDGLMLRNNKHGTTSAFADNWPNRAHFWFPSVDHPSDKATVEMIVTAPERYDVVGNGVLIETTVLQNGMERTSWRESTPIPVHCMVIGGTEFSLVDLGPSEGTPLLYYLYPEDADRGKVEFGRVPQMMSFFSQLIAPYPYGKLAIVESSTRFGGMENASAIFVDEKSVDGKGTMEGLVAHEIAHQWFGDSVSQRDWHDLWLSEGFATYFGHLFFEHADGREALLQLMRANRAAYMAANRRDSRPIHDPTITDLFALLNRNNYEKGAWVLHMLRGIMGDDSFFAGIRDYYLTHRSGNASTADLRGAMERYTDQPLDWFFRQWIEEPGHPSLAVRWSWSAGRTFLHIEQKQSGATFRVPLTIELQSAAGTTRHAILIDENMESIELPSIERPTKIVFDPDEWVLMEVDLAPHVRRRSARTP